MAIEFKIVQSNTPMFANTAKLKQIASEEARAGWELVEKVDNFKLRFQRDISHRANDDKLDSDPYRTQVGVSSVVTYAVTAVVTIAIVVIILGAAGFFGA
ncbi:MAG: hypothetical protein WD772_05525 [Pseudohongiellaceae bacterium]